MVRHAVCLVLLATSLAASDPVRAAGAAETAKRTAAGNTQFLLFNQPPAGSFDVRRNRAAEGSATAGPGGVLAYSTNTTAGDVFEFTLTGIEPVDPARPTGLSVTGGTEGCGTLRWNVPASDEYVTDYVIRWGTTAGVYTDSLEVDRLALVRSGSTYSYQRCSFPNGTYHFVIRAHNSFDRWSPLSASASATITNENTQGPPPPTGVAASETPPGCARVTWNAVGDPDVVGYRVYFGTRPRAQGAYTDSLDVATITNASRCGLAAGSYYVAVRSRTSLGLVSAYSTERSLTIVGPDVTPPVLSNRSPAAAATGVPTNAGISFTITDTRSGVDAGSISVWVNNVVCVPTTVPATNGFNVECDPPADLPANSSVTVRVVAADAATPANELDVSWSFQTGNGSLNDTTAPTLTAASPVAGASGVDGTNPIEVTVADTGLGVNLGTVVFRVNGDDVAFTVQGTPANARLTYRPATPFAAGTTVTVHIEACDHAAVANCAIPLDYAFEIGSQAALAGTPAAIVPNGFWAGDPARPLEVQNLPRAWTVRIFDPTGVAVRRFENTQTDGYNWAWDFTNDGGSRVAPAMYLVRVTDTSGSVQRSGRFLVQSVQ